MEDWYRLTVEELSQTLEVTAVSGLSSATAEQRLTQYGPNELVEKNQRSPWLMLLDQFKDLMVIILIISAIISAFLQELTDVIVILLIVIMNAVIGFTQEYRAEQAMAALKKLAVPTVKVRRDGRIQEISARLLVPGDVVVLEAGNLVPADGRIIESVNLKIEEAALTGESEPVEKEIGALSGSDIALGDRRNMMFMGTIITYGRGTAVITGTGMNTQLGKIADLIQEVESEQTPLQRRLEDLGKTLGWVALGIVAVVVFMGLLRGEKWDVLLLTGVSLAVAAVPEGLPAVVTITLALGSQRMLKRHALIRKLPAVEALGSVTVICSDKTGTLTENRMTVTVLDVVGHTQDIETLVDRYGAILDDDTDESQPHVRTLSYLLQAAALCSDAFLQEEDGVERTIGDPTEGALVVAAAKLGHAKEKMEARWPRMAEIPFTSERKRMTTIHAVGGISSPTEAPWAGAAYVAFSKGAVDSLLDVTGYLWDGRTIIPLDDAYYDRIMAANARLAAQGQRVLGVAFRLLETAVTPSETAVEADMVFIGLIAMIDPPRPEVKTAVSTARTAGIRPVMITGDHPLTAQHIAKDLHITDNDQHLTGRDLARMSIPELEEVVETVAVYARVSPEHKLNIVEALQDKGHIVAMTGDGVNDAPALKRADIGVAMGITGTDVSKEAADMVLLDDNFATIVAAVEEGRVIFDNIRKFILYILSSNVGELVVMFISPLLGMPLALLPLQILWINLVTDGLPGLALAMEKAERGVMRRPPFDPKQGVFSQGLGRRIIWIGMLVGLLSLGTGYVYWRIEPDGPWQSVIFTTLTVAQFGNALAVRSTRDSVFAIGFFSNWLMVLALFLAFGLQMLLLYVPFLQEVFHTSPLDVSHLLISLGISSIVFLTIEVEKWFLRRRPA